MPKIHMPDKEGIYYSLSVSPDKVYGGVKGSELIKRYKVKHRKPIVTNGGLIEHDGRITIPCGQLPDKVKIGDRFYNTRELFLLLEQITGRRILSKRYNRALKHMANTTIQVPLLLNRYSFDPLQIQDKDKTYLLTPCFK